MSYKSLTNKQKYGIVLKQNTFFFHNEEFEGEWEAYISSLTNLLLLLRSELRNKNTPNEKKECLSEFISEKPDGIQAILALSSISEEFVLRLFTFVRTTEDPELNKLSNKANYPNSKTNAEWGKAYLFRQIRENQEVTKGFVNLLFEGFSIPLLQKTLPLFELKKLNFAKLDFSAESLIDSLVRHARKGSYKAKEANDPAGLIGAILKKNRITHKSKKKVGHIRRSIDFVIPDETNPRIFIESSYEVTTSSAMGDKAKTEIEVAQDIRRFYPDSLFVGFVDGIGWYARKSDLKKLVSAFDNVFTFDRDELARFLDYIQSFLESEENE